MEFIVYQLFYELVFFFCFVLFFFKTSLSLASVHIGFISDFIKLKRGRRQMTQYQEENDNWNNERYKRIGIYIRSIRTRKLLSIAHKYK